MLAALQVGSRSRAEGNIRAEAHRAPGPPQPDLDRRLAGTGPRAVRSRPFRTRRTEVIATEIGQNNVVTRGLLTLMAIGPQMRDSGWGAPGCQCRMSSKIIRGRRCDVCSTNAQNPGYSRGSGSSPFVRTE